MRSLDKMFLISVFCAFVINVGASTVDINFRKEWSLVNKSRIFVYPENFARDDNRFLYTICSDPSNYKSGNLNCDVYLEKLNKVNNNNETSIKVCKVNTTLEKDEQEKDYAYHSISSIDTINANKAILVQSMAAKYKESGHTRVNIIDMTNCTIKHFDYFNDKDSNISATPPYIVIFPKSFDVFIFNKELCGDLERCRINYDAQGYQIGRPTFFPLYSTHIELYPKSSNSPDKGYFYRYLAATYNRSFHRLKYVDPKGVESIYIALMNTPSHRATSNTNDFYSECYYVSRYIDCVKYDEMGGQRRNVSLFLGLDIKPLGLHSLPNDKGFWLLVAHCDFYSNEECSGFNIIRFGENGHIETQIEINDPDLIASDPLNVRYPIHFNFSEDQDKICIYIVCLHKPLIDGKTGKKTIMKYIKKCVPQTYNI